MKKPIPFGKYLLLERVNVGGMAEVFKAKAFGVEGFERLVAVKRILPSIAEDQEFITMFIDEAKIAVQLTHANIAQIFDLGKVAESYFIAMEYVRGKDLRAIFDRVRARGGTVPVPMACYVVMKVCEGLDYAHNKKDASGRDLHLVHRDVSPQNLLLSYDGEVKIIDFGIAKAANKASTTQAGILKGKFGYMSPEQVRGLPLDRRSDVFAIGIVLYELLTGERLFVGESDFSTLEKVRNVEIMPPSTYNRKIPEELEQIVLKALAKDVDDRYQTAMDLHDDLQSFMYTSGNFFARKDLGGWQRETFSEEILKEEARDEEYRKIRAPGDSGLSAFDQIPARQEPPPARAPTPPPPPKASRPPTPPPPPPKPKPHKSTMLGMGAVSLPAARPPPPMAGPELDMDWDDDELATQIYDGPEGQLPPGPLGSPSAQVYSPQSGSLPVGVAPPGYAQPSAPPPRASAPPSLSAPVAPPPPSLSAPLAGPPKGSVPAPQSGHSPMISAVTQAPSFGTAAEPYVVGGGAPSPSVEQGAPSPFDLGPEPVAPTREPTALTRNPTETSGPNIPVIAGIALAAALLLGFVGWMVFGADEPGIVQLTTTPSDPVVLFDEQPVQSTSSPFVIGNVAPGGVHLIEVRKTGFQTWSTQVELSPGQTLPLNVTLERAGGGTGTGFALTTSPPGATVFVDGRELAERSPVRVADMQPGPHTIRATLAGSTDWQQQVSLSDGQMLELRATLEPGTVLVSFDSDPRGARVSIVRGDDSEFVGTTPTREEVDVSRGRVRVEMTLDGYEDWSERVRIPAGEDSFEVEAELEREEVAVRTPRNPRNPRMNTPREPREPREPRTPMTTEMVVSGGGGNGTIDIASRPWTEVHIDGRRVGNTPQRALSLSAGRHRVTFINPEFGIRETFSVTVRAGQHQRLIKTFGG